MVKWKIPIPAENETPVIHLIVSHRVGSRICLHMMEKWKISVLVGNQTIVTHVIASHWLNSRICLHMMVKGKIPVPARNPTLVTHVIASHWLNFRTCLHMMVKGKIPVPAGNQTPVMHLIAIHWLGPRIGLHMMKWKIRVPAGFFVWWFLVCSNNYTGLWHITDTDSEWHIGKATIMTHFKTILTFSWTKWGKLHEITSTSIEDSKWLHPKWEWYT